MLGITTDNARNMVSGVTSLQEEQEVQTLVNFEEDVIGAVEAMTDGAVNMMHVRCAAHTLQLAVRDALEEKRDVIDKVNQPIGTAI